MSINNKDVEEARAPDTADFADGHVFHVLLVCDCELTLLITSKVLTKQCRYHVTVARNGQEALDQLQGGLRVDLILSDVFMPQVGGLQLVAEMNNSQGPAPPVVVMSAQSSEDLVLRAIEAGAADYLIKPLRRNELAVLWRHVWLRSKASQAAPLHPASTSSLPSLESSRFSTQLASSSQVLSHAAQASSVPQTGASRLLHSPSPPSQTALQIQPLDLAGSVSSKPDRHLLELWARLDSDASRHLLLPKPDSALARAGEGMPRQYLNCSGTSSDTSCFTAVVGPAPANCREPPWLGPHDVAAYRTTEDCSQDTECLVAARCSHNRKVAIAKFRAKRKERRFEKKVRYESRRRLAEQRPRVRGQFVKAEVAAAHQLTQVAGQHVEGM